MDAHQSTCLVTIKRADIISHVKVRCIEDGNGKFLIVPLEDYALMGARGQVEMMLRVPGAWVVVVTGGEHDYFCREMIDLDKFNEAQWVDVPKT